MRECTFTRALFATSALATSTFLLYAFTHSIAPARLAPRFQMTSTAPGVSGATPPTAASAATTKAPIIDVNALLHPVAKYLGVAQDGVPNSMASLGQFGEEIGKKPDMVAYYVPWGQPLNQTWVLNLVNDGVLPLIQFEPVTATIVQIAEGASDSYATALAQTIKALNVPIVFSFGHEMNGNWYTWGTKKTRPADFVEAWRRIHAIFATVGANDVIWLWDANVTYPVPDIPLKPLYPGDTYVDWIGLTGYYNAAAGGRRTFDTLFVPTMEQVRRFSRKPFLIAETAASPSPNKPAEIDNLFASVESRPDVLGFVWFNCRKIGTDETDWMIDSDPASSATFSALAHDPRWGMPITP